MGILRFESQSTGPSRVLGKTAAPPDRKERLAIISTSNQLCGIAAYTDPLARHLEDLFDVTIFDLDQYLLRNRHRHIIALGDRRIKEICQELPQFDAVNLQLEHGTLGGSEADTLRRFGWIVVAAPRLSVAFHSLFPPPSFDHRSFWHALVRRRPGEAAKVWTGYQGRRKLSWGIAASLRRQQRRKQVTAIAHNRRDAKDLQYLYRIDNVTDHPLAFLSAAEAAQYRERSSRRSFPMLAALPEDAVLIGVFGFLSKYKGIGTAIRALHHLPKNVHLLIFGGIHPNDIQREQPLHPYLSSLLDDAYVDASLYQRLARQPGADSPSLVLNADHTMIELLASHPKDLSERVHFMGVPNDDEFRTGMAICDAVVFPYVEVGQSSSGAIAQAVELGCRVIASRTRNFLEFARYHPNTIEFFDIGNHLELAGRILARRQFAAVRNPEFNVETNKALYLLANSKRTRPLAPRERRMEASLASAAD